MLTASLEDDSRLWNSVSKDEWISVIENAQENELIDEVPDQILLELVEFSSEPNLTKCLDWLFDLTPTSSESYNGSIFDNFNPETKLHSLGYVVGINGLSTHWRHKILENAVVSEQLTKAEILNTIENNISIFQNRPSHQIAVDEWQEDYYWVLENL